jgi:hypothetical protein
VVVVVDSLPAGLVVVVVVSDEVVPLGLAAGATVSVFCSQAASSAAPARMQMYFFIGLLVKKPNTRVNPKSEQGRFSVVMFSGGLAAGLNQKGGMYLNPCASATAWQVSFPSRVLIPPRRADCNWHAFSSP